MADARNNGHMIGRLGADPEFKMTPNGVPLATFRIAVQDTFNKDETHWFTGVAWRQNAEFMAEYCAKGNLIAITYHLKTEKWDDKKSGEERSTVKLEVEAVANITPRAADDDDEKPAKKKARRDEDEDEKPARKKARRDDDDDEDEKPAKKKRASDDDDEDEAPKKKKRAADDDDDEDEKPAKKKRKSDEEFESV